VDKSLNNKTTTGTYTECRLWHKQAHREAVRHAHDFTFTESSVIEYFSRIQILSKRS